MKSMKKKNSSFQIISDFKREKEEQQTRGLLRENKGTLIRFRFHKNQRIIQHIIILLIIINK